MDKAGFLKELKKYLAILNESEQKDILDEYTQHIDMKMEKGMSEPEAIGDFGDIGELAAEILEAYHVNPQYGSKKRIKLIQKDEIPVQELKETSAHVWNGVTGAVRKLCIGVWNGVKKVCGFLAIPFVSAVAYWKQRKEAVSGREKSNSEIPKLQKSIAAGNLVGKAGHGMSWFMKMIWFFILTCIRWFWNGCMVFVALISGGFSLFGIFGLGTLVVLLLQGYPLLGITIASLGAVMCFGGITVLFLSLIRRKKIESRQQPEQEIVVQEVLEHA